MEVGYSKRGPVEPPGACHRGLQFWIGHQRQVRSKILNRAPIENPAERFVFRALACSQLGCAGMVDAEQAQARERRLS